MITHTAKIDIEQAHLPREEKIEFKEYIMNTEGRKQHLE